MVGQCGAVQGDYFDSHGATSAACAYAAGAVACLQSAAKQINGSYLSPSEVRQILTSTGDNINDPKANIAKPRINLAKAVQRISTPPEPTNEYCSNDVPREIEDEDTITSTLVITDSGTIADLNVKLDISHSYIKDLDVFLIGPDMTRVELFTDVGGSGDSFSDTILDDEASSPVTQGSAPFAGSYKPEGKLSDFDGKNITGTWTLEVTDDAGGDTGTLNSWCLIVEK